MRARFMTSILVLFALAVPAFADSGGDPGLELEVPDLVGIGEPFDLCLAAPGDSLVVFFVSTGDGPTDTPFGSLCLDFPTLVTLPLIMPGAGSICLQSSLPCDRDLLGFTAYLQFVAPSLGVSNSASMTVVDNGRCG